MSPSAKVTTDQRVLPKAVPFALQITATFITTTAFLFLLSRLLLPSWQFIPSVYLTPLQLPDLTPNPGLWWYFFIEMFDAFRSFFLGVFWLHMFSYSIPFCLRLRGQPLAAVVLMMGVCAVFEPYANAGAVGTWLSCLCLLGHVFERKSSYFSPHHSCSHTRPQPANISLPSLFTPSLLLSSSGSNPLLHPTWPSFPPFVDLCRIRECEFFLRDYAGVELGAADIIDGYDVCGFEG